MLRGRVFDARASFSLLLQKSDFFLYIFFKVLDNSGCAYLVVSVFDFSIELI